MTSNDIGLKQLETVELDLFKTVIGVPRSTTNAGKRMKMGLIKVEYKIMQRTGRMPNS